MFLECKPISGKAETKTLNSQAGFTLLEMLLVMIIAGFLVVMLIQASKVFNHQSGRKYTEAGLKNAKSSLDNFVAVKGYYPCPADRTADPADLDFGREDRQIIQTADGGFPGPCQGPMLPDGRDLEGDGTVEGAFIGMIPLYVYDRTVPDLANPGNVIDTWVPLTDFSTRKNSANKTMLDYWRNPFSYSVSERLTEGGTFNPDHGSISIRGSTSNGLTAAEAIIHYAVISHGEDGCTNLGTGAGTSINCKIVSTDTEFREHNILNSDAPDYLAYGAFWGNSSWEYTAAGTGVSTDIYNANNGNVGIGTATPQLPLDVVGNIMAENYVRAENGFCTNYEPDPNPPFDLVLDPNGSVTQCFDAEVLFNIDCSANPGEYLSGIEVDNSGVVTPVCEEFQTAFVIPPGGLTCPTFGHMIAGIYSDGTLNCFPP